MLREREREKERENQMIISYNPITISCNVSFQMEKDMAAHLERGWKASYIHQVVSHKPSERCERHSHAGMC